MSENMVDLCCAAVLRARYGEGGNGRRALLARSKRNRDEAADIREEVRATIAALREPTAAMLVAMRAADLTGFGPVPSWKAGIDVALSEGPET